MKAMQNGIKVKGATILMMFLILEPILLKFLGSDSLKRLVIDLLRAWAKRTDNHIDDQLCDVVEHYLFPAR